MACSTIIKGISEVCGRNIGGLKEVWIGQYGTLTFTYEYLQDLTDPDNPVDILDADGNKIPISISGATLAAGADTFQKFNFVKNTASATNTLNVSDNGANYFDNAVNMYFKRQDGDKRLSVQSLVEGETSALVLDKNGNYWFYGLEDYLNVSEGTVETGAAPSDNNGYNITLSVSESRLPLPVAAAAVTVITGA